LNFAARIVETLEDRDAKIFSLLALYSISKDKKFLDDAMSIAENDDDFLRIVEYSEFSAELINIVQKIKNRYKKNVAYSILLEKTGDMNFATKIKDVRILAASMKRLALKKTYPENLSIARMIPDPYYRSLALIEISYREKIDLDREIKDAVGMIKNMTIRRRLLRKIGKMLNCQNGTFEHG